MRPYTAAEAGVGRVTCRIAPVEGGLALVAEIEMPRRGAQELVVVETGNPDLWVAQADTSRTATGSAPRPRFITWRGAACCSIAGRSGSPC